MMNKQKSLMVIAMLLLVMTLPSAVNARGNGHADLSVASFEAIIGSVSEDGLTPVILYWNIDNVGKKSTGPFAVELRDDDNVIEAILYPSLLPKTGSLFDQRTLNLIPGEYTFRLVVDPGNKIKEVKENNNEMTVTVIVDSPPPITNNIIISDVGYYPSEPGNILVGDPVGVSFVVINDGNVPVRVPVEVKLDENLTIIEMTLDLPPGGSISVEELSNFKFNSPGQYKISVEADPDNTILETNEADNHGKILINVNQPPLPNIALSNCYAFGKYQRPGSAFVGDQIGFSCDIENNGKAPSNNFEFVVFAESEGLIEVYRETLSLGIGEKRTISAITNHRFLAEGTVFLDFIANEDWFIKEITYGDNYVFEEVFVGPSPIFLPQPIS